MRQRGDRGGAGAGAGAPHAQGCLRSRGGEEVRELSGGVAVPPAVCARVSLALAGGDPAGRVSAASVLRWLLANGQLRPAEGLALVQQLAQDPDPAIRIAAVGAFLMFNADFAVPAVTALSSDPDPAVALAARNTLGEIEVIRKVGRASCRERV